MRPMEMKKVKSFMSRLIGITNMNYQDYAKSLPTDQLKTELKQLRSSIDDFDCFGVRDLVLESALAEELHKRGNN